MSSEAETAVDGGEQGLTRREYVLIGTVGVAWGGLGMSLLVDDDRGGDAAEDTDGATQAVTGTATPSGPTTADG